MRHRIEAALTSALARVDAGGPPTLAAALRHAVFPGGARVRPRLCIAVAEACGDDLPALTDAAAASLELLHCASLIHDDLPCFDDADLRRGRPTVHRQFGEPLAVLAGDALIVLSFELLARAAVSAPARLPGLVSTVARATGTPFGLVAGQAWESERAVPLQTYHRAKTGSLFMAATMSGALAAGSDPTPWRDMGERLGEAYQVADDLMDVLANAGEAGKPTSQDACHRRPNAAFELGVPGAMERLKSLVAEAVEAVPNCPGAEALRGLVHQVAARLIPEGAKQTAA